MSNRTLTTLTALTALGAGSLVAIVGCWGSSTTPDDGPAGTGGSGGDRVSDAAKVFPKGEAREDGELLARAEETYAVSESGGFQVRTHKRAGGDRSNRAFGGEAGSSRGGIGGGGGAAPGMALAEADDESGGWDGGDEGLAPARSPRPMADPTAGAEPMPTDGAPLRRLSEERERGGRDSLEKTKAQAVTAPLRAGETDDNEAFDEYLAYRQRLQEQYPDLAQLTDPLDITERYILAIADEDGRPLPNCQVAIAADDTLLWQGTTTSDGTMPFFPRTVAAAEGKTDFTISLVYGDARAVHEMKRKKHGADDPIPFAVPGQKRDGKTALDVLFVIDTTGSMGDEIAQIQATLLQITERIENLPEKPALRFGMVLYRDRTDDYVTKAFSFTDDVASFNEALQSIGAAGGGDGPEALNMGLYDGVETMGWRDDALRLAFLVADAPPHMDYGDDVPYGASLRSAVEKGIKIFPVAASGLDQYPSECGTYIYRQIAQFTQGRFIYIEYGASAASHGVAKPKQDGGNNLDDIVVRTVTRELEAYVK